MQMHCGKIHGWVNTRKRGGQRVGADQEHGRNKMWEEGIHYQQFFHSGGRWQRLFQVEAEQHYREQGHIQSDAEVVISRGKQALKRGWAEVEQQKEEQPVDGQPSRYEANAWLRRTGWA